MKSTIIESVSVAAGGRLLQFQRRLNAPPQAVWAALTEPEKVRQWYALITDYPVEGKPLELRFENSNVIVGTTITRLNRPNVLEYTWNSQVPANAPVSLVGSIVHFELTPNEAGTVLSLDHIFPTDAVPIADVLGGWQAHLDELADKLHGGGFQAAAKPLVSNFVTVCATLSTKLANALGIGSVQG